MKSMLQDPFYGIWEINWQSQKTFYFSECEDLLRHMLEIDPNKRIKMSDIVQHRWLQQGERDEDYDGLIHESLNTNTTESAVFIDSVLTHMETLGLQVDEVKKVLVHVIVASILRIYKLITPLCPSHSVTLWPQRLATLRNMAER